MTAEQFAYWLQDYAELNEAPPSAEQWQSIREHLALVFNKVTPQRSPGYPQWSPTSAPIDYDLLPRVTCTAIAGNGEARLVC